MLCNNCGEICTKYHDETPVGNYGLVKAIVEGGYYSTYLEDCYRYEFNLCEKCLKEIFEKFKIPVSKKEFPI